MSAAEAEQGGLLAFTAKSLLMLWVIDSTSGLRLARSVSYAARVPSSHGSLLATVSSYGPSMSRRDIHLHRRDADVAIL